MNDRSTGMDVPLPEPLKPGRKRGRFGPYEDRRTALTREERRQKFLETKRAQAAKARSANHPVGGNHGN